MRAVEVVDPLTVRLRLDRPHAPLLANLAYPAGYMVSPAAVTKFGKAFGRAPVGTGPFRFALWESQRQVRLLANETYRDGPPKLKALVFRPIADANARASEMLAGGLDVLVELAPDSAPAFRDERALSRCTRPAALHLWFLILNTRDGPLKDPRMRQAVNLAIDKEAMSTAPAAENRDRSGRADPGRLRRGERPEPRALSA